MNGRRIALDMTWDELATRARIASGTLRGIRNGNNPSQLTTRRLEEALQWAPGSIDAVLKGHGPTPAKVARIETAENHIEAQPFTPVLDFPANYPDDMELTEQEKLQWQTLRDIPPDARRRVIQYTRLERERETQQEQQTSP